MRCRGSPVSRANSRRPPAQSSGGPPPTEQAFGVPIDHFEPARIVLWRSASTSSSSSSSSSDRRQRRPQLVRNEGDELVLHAVELDQASSSLRVPDQGLAILFPLFLGAHVDGGALRDRGLPVSSRTTAWLSLSRRPGRQQRWTGIRARGLVARCASRCASRRCRDRPDEDARRERRTRVRFLEAVPSISWIEGSHTGGHIDRIDASMCVISGSC